MCIIGSGGFAHFAEYLTWLMGYETLCYALFDQRDLVEAIAGQLLEIYDVVVRADARVRPRQGDLGLATTWAFARGTLISPDDMRELRPARATRPWPRPRTTPVGRTCCTRAATCERSWTT